MFWKNKKLHTSAKKVDKIVTTLIIGSAIASIFWLASKTKKGKDMTQDLQDKMLPVVKSSSKKAVSLFGRAIAFVVWIFSKK